MGCRFLCLSGGPEPHVLEALLNEQHAVLQASPETISVRLEAGSPGAGWGYGGVDVGGAGGTQDKCAPCL